jgi:hypothetical protein
VKGKHLAHQRQHGGKHVLGLEPAAVDALVYRESEGATGKADIETTPVAKVATQKD